MAGREPLIHGTVSEIVFEPHVGGEVYEVAESGERGHWATVLEWEPPSRLVLAWNILDRGDVTEVEVRFLAADGQTRVELEHRGWENVELDAPAEAWGLRRRVGSRPRQVRRSRRLDADVDRLRGRPVLDQLANEEREATRCELAGERLQLLERPPANVGDVLGVQLCPGQAGRGSERSVRTR